jgi:transcriptional repressor NrdR
VVDSRLAEPGDAVRRRRECEGCGVRFTTYERVEAPAVTVVKRDGTRQRFDRQKLVRGLGRAANKRPVSEEQLEQLADSIAAELRARGPESRAEEIGELALRGLVAIDPVTAIQFASVYRQFADLDELEAEVRRLKRQASVPSGARSNIPSPRATVRDQGEGHKRKRRGHAEQP